MLAAAVALVAPVPAPVVERYFSSAWYQWLQPVLTAMSNRVPFALLDPMMAAIVVGLLVMWVRVWTQADTAWRGVGRGLVLTTGLAAALYLVFLVTWGLNYRREPLSRRLAFEDARVTPAAVEDLAARSVAELNRLWGPAHDQPWPGGEALVRRMGPAFAVVQADLGHRRPAIPGVPKSTVLGLYFRLASVSGMTDPYFLEVMLTPDALPFEHPALLAHEWGHLAGYAHEAEAGFVGWVTAMRSGIQGQYSAWLDLYPRLAASLPATVRATLDETLDEGPRSDYEAIANRLALASPRLRRAAWQGYDRFLKANRVAEGVASYDRVVILIVGTRFGDDWRLVAAGR